MPIGQIWNLNLPHVKAKLDTSFLLSLTWTNLSVSSYSMVSSDNPKLQFLESCCNSVQLLHSHAFPERTQESVAFSFLLHYPLVEKYQQSLQLSLQLIDVGPPHRIFQYLLSLPHCQNLKNW